MILYGLRLQKFLGWISGVYFTCTPWMTVTKKFTSYCHPYTFYALAINVAFILLWKDIFDEIRHVLQGKSLTITLFVVSSTLSMHFCQCYLRCIFFVLAKRISALLSSVETMIQTASNIPKDLRGTWRLFRLFLWFLLIFHTSTAALTTLFYYKLSEQNQRKNTLYFHEQQRPWWYFLILLFFGTLPTALCVYFAFGFIFTTTFCIMAIFEDFSLSLHAIGRNYLEEQCRLNKDKRIDLDNLALTIGPLGNDNDTDLSSLDQEDIEIRRSSVAFAPSWDVMKVDLLHRFDQVKSIFAQYDFIVGPLVLGLIIRNAFTVINGATAIIVGKNPLDESVNRGCNWAHLFGDLIQFVILELGSWTTRRMDKWKMDLEKMILLMPTSLEKDHLSDVVHQVSKWKWQMSACGFFHVNRQLMSGIVSTMLSYIVILFQLHVSESSV